MRKIPLLFVLVIVLALYVSCTGRSGGDKLAGMYKLHIMENLDSATGVWQIDPWYDGGESYILYDGLGHMAVQITSKGYKEFNWFPEEQSINESYVKQQIDTMSVDQLKEGLLHFSRNYVYTANYEIDDASGVVTHHRITGTIPAIWGTTVKRSFQFSGDTIILRVLDGNRRLKWIRQP